MIPVPISEVSERLGYRGWLGGLAWSCFWIEEREGKRWFYAAVVFKD